MDSCTSIYINAFPSIFKDFRGCIFFPNLEKVPPPLEKIPQILTKKRKKPLEISKNRKNLKTIPTVLKKFPPSWGGGGFKKNIHP